MVTFRGISIESSKLNQDNKSSFVASVLRAEKYRETGTLDLSPAEIEAGLAALEAELERGAIAEVAAGKFRTIPAWATLEQARSMAGLAIDTKAEELRKKHLSPGEGKAMAYLYQQQISRDYRARRAAGEIPQATDWPLVEARRRVLSAALGREATVEDVIGEWEALEALWHQLEAAIDAVVWAAKLTLGAAGTVTEVQAVWGGLDWPAV